MKDALHSKKLYGTATVGSKGQIVIPSDAREELGIATGERLYVVGMPNKKVIVLIKEEQMSQFVEHITDEADNVKAKLAQIKGE